MYKPNAIIFFGRTAWKVSEVIDDFYPDEVAKMRLEVGNIYGAQKLINYQYNEGRRRFKAGEKVHDFEPLALRWGWEDAKDGIGKEMAA